MNNKVSLILTTFNRASLLNNSLQRLTSLTIPDEVLIVDDGSSDNTKQVAEDFQNKLPIKYIYNHNPEWSICSFARNIGIKNSVGDILITSEPELIFVTDVIKQMLEHHGTHPEEVVTAGTVYHAQAHVPYHPSIATDTPAALKDSIVEEYVIEPRPYRQDGYVKSVGLVASYAALYEKKWLLDVGGWDEGFAGAWGWDDTDLLTRLRINGINQDRANDIEVLHQWHPHLPPHVQGPAAKINEDRFIAKRLDQSKKGDPSLVANKGKEWGVIRKRP